MLDGLIASAARHSRRSIVLSSFYRGELPELRRRSIGPDLVFGRLWQETGCAEVLRNLLGERQFGFDVERAIYLTVLHRLMVSGSDRHAHDWHQTSAHPGRRGADAEAGLQGHGLARRARADDRPPGMTEAHRGSALPPSPTPVRRARRSPSSTPPRCISRATVAPRLGQRGHSKDFRPQLHQVVLGIVLDGHDRPIASFLWPGNTADVTTLLPVVERLRTRFGIGRALRRRRSRHDQCRHHRRARGRRRSTTSSARASDRATRCASTVIDDDGVAIPLTIPRQKGETDLAIKDVVVAGRRYVLCRNAEQARKDAETRTALLAGLERKLTQGDKALVGNAGYRRFLAEPAATGSPSTPRRSRRMRISMACSCLRTNTKLVPLRGGAAYRNLLAVEQSFLAAKTLLATRPIFHRTDAAIRGHIFCTFLALVLRKELMDLLEPTIRPAGMESIVDDLLDQ